MKGTRTIRRAPTKSLRPYKAGSAGSTNYGGHRSLKGAKMFKPGQRTRQTGPESGVNKK